MIRTALSNPYLVIVAALAVTVLGAYSYTKIPADLLPQFETSAVQIVCFYPGMPPEVMEKDIMSRLQRWTGQSVGIEHQEAKAMQGVCVVKDFFVEGVSMDTAMSQVTAYAMSDMFYLPPGTIPPMTMPFDPTANVPLCLVVVSNPQMNETELYDIAYYELRNKLQSIQGVIAPAVYGGKLRRVLAYVDRQKLEAYGLSLMDVQRALLRQNVLIPAGSIKIGEPDPGYTVGKEEHPDSDLILLVSNTGVLMDWPAAYTPNTGAMDTFMLVQIKGRQSIFDYVTRLRAQLNEKYPDVEFSFDTGGMLTAALNMGEPSPIHFQIQSSNLETAQEVARSIVKVAERTEGTADVRIAQRIDYPVLNVKMNRELAARQNIYADDVMKNLVAATNSTVGFDPSFWVDKNKGNHYFFGVQYREEDLNSLETLKNIPIGSDASGPRRLSNVAEIFHETGPAVVNHRNITRVTDVYLNVLPGFDFGSVVTKIEAGLESLGAKPVTDERGSLYKIGYITPKEIAAGEMTPAGQRGPAGPRSDPRRGQGPTAADLDDLADHLDRHVADGVSQDSDDLRFRRRRIQRPTRPGDHRWRAGRDGAIAAGRAVSLFDFET